MPWRTDSLHARRRISVFYADGNGRTGVRAIYSGKETTTALAGRKKLARGLCIGLMNLTENKQGAADEIPKTPGTVTE